MCAVDRIIDFSYLVTYFISTHCIHEEVDVVAGRCCFLYKFTFYYEERMFFLSKNLTLVRKHYNELPRSRKRAGGKVCDKNNFSSSHLNNNTFPLSVRYNAIKNKQEREN